ncbi:hypothetical protein NA57DRAFT_25674, partial [Rhizodiscina lignyota]
PPENVNLIPGGTANTAGGEKFEDYSWWSVLKSIRPQEYEHFIRLPCVRDALLFGIPAGASTGSLLGDLGPILRSCQYALGASGATTFLKYEHCQWQRQREKQGVKRAVEIMSTKQLEKEKVKEEAKQRRRKEREEREKAEEEARLEQERRRKQWWRFW